MPKRKRYANADKDYNGTLQKNAVARQIAQGRKLLHRALKTAKGFERQKLGKRLTRADSTELKARLNMEIDVLRALDLDNVANTHMYKTFFKIKAFRYSGFMTEDLVKKEKEEKSTDAHSIAMNNVVSGILNMKTIKETTERIVKDMYHTLGIPISTQRLKSESDTKHSVNRQDSSVDIIPKLHLPAKKEIIKQNDIKSPDEGAIESSEEIERINFLGSLDIQEDASLDEDNWSQYDEKLGTSSSETDSEKGEYSKRRAPLLSSPPKLDAESEDINQSRPHDSLSRKAFAQAKPRLESKAYYETTPKIPIKPGLSTFLPTLMGGYWSGSEESASDIEDLAPISKKNRRGQRERRAIAEKKYGQKAKHIVSGQASNSKSKERDEGWDLRRGATINTGLAGRGQYPRRAFSRPKPQQQIDKTTIKIGRDGANQVRHRDDVGILHPSWQAAKKAKEKKQTAVFHGKKVTFD
ncbi:BgTH12-05117 [Blumeria graminis f. sp. triticale]|uniref:Bud22 domain-containing protein n=4 Tax=Blumeria graminis TaxID=34373 RepID=A0A656KMH9_BLUGR|nr:hypothetical protein BGT96224_3044 [Blumeria graminis f. sp. tritici 96224]CAD6502525.1 BgTH12-05117 [Blumeria graminis f. sp. triticale]VDB87896.1 Bgt-3044 [Blumeria graminis f. sp. tritici]